MCVIGFEDVVLDREIKSHRQDLEGCEGLQLSWKLSLKAVGSDVPFESNSGRLKDGLR